MPMKCDRWPWQPETRIARPGPKTDYWAACCEQGAEHTSPSLQKLLLNPPYYRSECYMSSSLPSWVDITRNCGEWLCCVEYEIPAQSVSYAAATATVISILLGWVTVTSHLSHQDFPSRGEDEVNNGSMHELPAPESGHIYDSLPGTSKLMFEGTLFSVFCFFGMVSQKILKTSSWRVRLFKRVVRRKIQFPWELVISNTASAKFTNDFL